MEDYTLHTVYMYVRAYSVTLVKAVSNNYL